MMPILFGASAMASVGSILELLPVGSEARAIANQFGRIGQIGELAASALMERQASDVERVGRPFREKASGAIWRTAAILTASSVVVAVLPGRSRTKRVASAILGILGSAVMRFSIEQLGKASARDARASFQQQRLGIE